MPDPANFLTLAQAELPLFVGIDLGGTNIKFGLVDSQGRTLAYHTVPTEVPNGPDPAIAKMAEAAEHLLNSAGARREQVASIGLATPGPMDLEQGMMLTPGNLPGWWNIPIRKMVAEACGLPVRYANDANAAAYGEYWLGAGQDAHSMVLLTLGTGVGGGIVIEDLLVEGSHSCGAECGFLVIDPSPDARSDSLGTTGTLEAYCGSYGVVGRAEDALAAGRSSSLEQVWQGAEGLTPLAIAHAAEEGDPLAWEIIEETAHRLAIGIVTLIHAVDPDSVVLGGAMTFGGAGHPLGERFLAEVRAAVRPRLLPALQEAVSIDFATLGGDAGYLGAAGLARRDMHPSRSKRT